MLSPTRGNFTLRSRRSLLPKAALAIVLLILILQITVYTPLLEKTGPIISNIKDSKAAFHHYASYGKLFNGTTSGNDTFDDFSFPRDFNQSFLTYGTTNCVPQFDDDWVQLAMERNRSCNAAPFVAHETKRVGIATWMVGQPQEAYLRAIGSQILHSAVHGSTTHVLCERLVNSPFNKIAFLLHLAMVEFLKPRNERLEWILYLDGDAMIIDPCRPLSSFLPPNMERFSKVNVITTDDWNGLNNGAFFFRPNMWNIELFYSILGYPFFRPDEKLTWHDQSAMSFLLKDPKWQAGAVTVPMYWFNAFAEGMIGIENYRDNLEPKEWWQARKGDFVLHFAGVGGRDQLMPEWQDMLAGVPNVWVTGDYRRDVTGEVAKYWHSWEHGNLTDAQKTGKPQPQVKVIQAPPKTEPVNVVAAKPNPPLANPLPIKPSTENSPPANAPNGAKPPPPPPPINPQAAAKPLPVNPPPANALPVNPPANPAPVMAQPKLSLPKVQGVDSLPLQEEGFEYEEEYESFYEDDDGYYDEEEQNELVE